MNYMIAQFELINRNMTMDVCKSGNEYTVGMNHNGQYTVKRFSDLDRAMETFNEIIANVVKGGKI